MSAARQGRRPAGGRWTAGNLWLAVVAVVQVGLLALVLLTVARPPSTKAGPLLGAGFKPSDVTAFTVTGHGGSSISLEHVGVHWVLPKLGDYPAQASRVTSVLKELAGLQRTGLVAITKDAYKRLQVAPGDYQRKVVLSLKGGKSETLYVGSEPTYGSTHVRLASDKGVYVTHSLHASDIGTDGSSYVDITALKLDQANVTRLAIKNANGDFVFSKGQGGWTATGLPSGRKLDSKAITGVLTSLTDLQLNEPLGKTAKPAYGFAKPLAVVTITTVSSQGGAKGKPASGSAGKTASAASATTSAKPAGAPTTTSAASQTAAATKTSATTSAKTSAATAAPAAKPKTVTTTTTITVGAKDKAGFYPVRISSSPFLVRASGYSLGDVMSKKASDFLVKPASTGSSSGKTGGPTTTAPGGLIPIAPGGATTTGK